jgi:hypothetical protein
MDNHDLAASFHKNIEIAFSRRLGRDRDRRKSDLVNRRVVMASGAKYEVQLTKQHHEADRGNKPERDVAEPRAACFGLADFRDRVLR